MSSTVDRGKLRTRYRTVVIGAGQAGLSAGYHLLRRGMRPWVDFVMLDANDGPGGAWRDRWDSLTFGKAHHLHPLPDFELATPDPTEPASAVVSRYYGEYEQHMGLPVYRSAPVVSVSRKGTGSAAGFEVELADGTGLRATTVINATGTWSNPFWPSYRGMNTFTGLQVHTRNFTGVQQFANRRTLVVGGGASATQFIVQLDAAGIDTLWSTRTPPRWKDFASTRDWGLEVERRVTEDTRAGRPPRPVVANTGLPLTGQMRAAIASGLMISRGPISRLEADAVVFSDGSRERIDAILWATGFRHALKHLAPLKLRTAQGGIRMSADAVSAADQPGLYLVGYGASASTIGATRAGRRAAIAAIKHLKQHASGMAGTEATGYTTVHPEEKSPQSLRV